MTIPPKTILQFEELYTAKWNQRQSILVMKIGGWIAETHLRLQCMAQQIFLAAALWRKKNTFI